MTMRTPAARARRVVSMRQGASTNSPRSRPRGADQYLIITTSAEKGDGLDAVRSEIAAFSSSR